MKSFVKKHKIISAIAIILIVLIAVLFIFRQTWTSMLLNKVTDSLSQMTGTKVEVKDFSLYIMAGKITINEVKVGNPEGYHTPSSLAFKELTVDLDIGSLFSDKIVIEQLLIDGMHVTFETGLTENNLSTIMDNVKKYSKKGKTEEESPEATKAEGPKKTFVIHDLQLKNGKLSVSSTYLNGQKATLSIADIELKNIGSDSANGKDAAEIMLLVLKDIYKKAKESLKDTGTSTTIPTKGITDDIKEGTNKTIKSIKDLF